MNDNAKTHFEKITLTNANLKRPLRLVLGSIGAYYWNESTKSNIVCTTTGIYPVQESIEQIDALIDEAVNRSLQGGSIESRQSKPGNTGERKTSPSRNRQK